MRALIFDLDGTLVDTVYGHVLAWQLALAEAGMPLDGWRIHRRIGMSGGLFTRALAREVGHPITPEQSRFLQVRRPLPGAVELLRRLHRSGVPHGIATSGRRPDIDASLAALELEPDVVV